MKPTVFTMMGYPGAGKSTFAKKLAEKMKIIRLNSDALREQMFAEPENTYNKEGYAELFGAMDYATAEIIRAGQSIIYDAKCNRLSERQKNAMNAKAGGGYPITIWVKLPLEASLESTRNRENTGGSQAFDETRVKMHSNDTLDEPQPDEPAIIINGREPFENQYQSFLNQLHQYSTNQ